MTSNILLRIAEPVKGALGVAKASTAERMQIVTNGKTAGSNSQPKEGNSVSVLLAMAAMSSRRASGESLRGTGH
jgi:hypothetical protein